MADEEKPIVPSIIDQMTETPDGVSEREKQNKHLSCDDVLQARPYRHDTMLTIIGHPGLRSRGFRFD